MHPYLVAIFQSKDVDHEVVEVDALCGYLESFGYTAYGIDFNQDYVDDPKALSQIHCNISARMKNDEVMVILGEGRQRFTPTTREKFLAQCKFCYDEFQDFCTALIGPPIEGFIYE